MCQLVAGAVASSGPVHAELDFYQYLQVVQNSLQTVGGQPCLNAVRSAFQSLQGEVLLSVAAALAHVMGVCVFVIVYRL